MVHGGPVSNHVVDGVTPGLAHDAAEHLGHEPTHLGAGEPGTGSRGGSLFLRLTYCSIIITRKFILNFKVLLTYYQLGS